MFGLGGAAAAAGDDANQEPLPAGQPPGEEEEGEGEEGLGEEADDDEALLDEGDEEDEDEEAALAIPPLGTYLGAAASGGGSPASASAGPAPARRRGSTAGDELPPAGLGDDDEEVIYSWGQAAYHELGHGDNVERATPTPIEYCRGKRIVAACAGNEHTALLSQDGVVYVAGYNDSGQCGLGHTERVPQLAPLEALQGKKRVALIHSANGCEHLLCVTEEGELYSCGYSSRGQTGHGVATQGIHVPRPVSALRSHKIKLVGCSYYHTLCATDSDLCFAFGRGDYGQLGTGATADSLTPALVEAVSGRGILSLACGQYHSCVATAEAGLLTMGKNDFGQCGVQDTSPRLLPGPVATPLAGVPVVQTTAGYYHTTVLTASGSVFAFGRNDFGQLGLGTRENSWRPQEVKGLLSKTIVQISAGCYHTLALDDGGNCWAAGRNNHCQLGRDKSKQADSPKFLRVAGLQDRFVTSVSSGFYHSIAITCKRSGEGPLGAARGLAVDLLQLLDNERQSDVRFLVEGQVVHAHRAILVSRCEPFARMLEGGMREAARDYTIPIPEVSHACFLAFLEYIYSDDVAALRGPGHHHHHRHAHGLGVGGHGHGHGPLLRPGSQNQRSLNQRLSSLAVSGGGGGGGGSSCRSSSNNHPTPAATAATSAGARAAAAEAMVFAMDLLSLADQYLMDGLKRKCEHAILRAVSCSNVSAVLATADARNAADLRRRCLDFIFLHFSRVIATKAFAELPTPLLHEVLVEAARRGVTVGSGAGAAPAPGPSAGAGAGGRGAAGGAGTGYPGGWGGY